MSDLMVRTASPSLTLSGAVEACVEEFNQLAQLLPKRRKNLQAFYEAWNSPAGVKVRRTGLHKQSAIGYTKAGKPVRRWCRYCSSFRDGKEYGYKTGTSCLTCLDTPLCRFVRKDASGRRNNNSKSCFEKWHEGRTLKNREINQRPGSERPSRRRKQIEPASPGVDRSTASQLNENPP